MLYPAITLHTSIYLSTCPRSEHPHSSSTDRPASGNQAGLDITVLVQNVQFYLQAAISKSTMRSYNSGCCHYYTDFCSRSDHSPLPTSETILCQFASFLGQQQLKHKTIISYLSSVRFFHITFSGNDAFVRHMPRLQYVLHGIKSQEAKTDKQSRSCLPVTPAIFTQIHHIHCTNERPLQLG